MTLSFRYALLFATLLLVTIQSNAQVTIGSKYHPINGSLLDLKETNVTDGANSTKGIVFPRVSLTQKNSLIDITDVNFANVDEQRLHTGLTVYNINPNFDKGTGLHFWDGTKWVNTKPDTVTVTVNVNIDKSYFTGMANDATSLLSVGIGGAAWRTLAFKTVPIDSKACYNTTTGVFKANATGTFNIYVRFIHTGLGIAQTVGIAVYKKAIGQSTFTQLFINQDLTIIGTGGVKLINQPNVALNAGDELMFELRSGGINLAVASGGASVSAIIKQN